VCVQPTRSKSLPVVCVYNPHKFCADSLLRVTTPKYLICCGISCYLATLPSGRSYFALSLPSQDLTAYKKYKEKAVASAARSLITLFREIAPYMLEKKDRGRGADLEARPMEYGAGTVRVSLTCCCCCSPVVAAAFCTASICALQHECNQTTLRLFRVSLTCCYCCSPVH